jgi:hypothetical protein
MKLEHQVCAIEQAIEFNKYGILAESLWTWCFNHYDHSWSLRLTKETEQLLAYGIIHECCFAYSCAELGVMLPENIHYGKRNDNRNTHISYLKLDRRINCYKFLYPHVISGNIKEHEAHAKADLLINLREQKIIKPENVKL